MGRILVSGSKENLIKFWDPCTGTALELRSPCCTRFILCLVLESKYVDAMSPSHQHKEYDTSARMGPTWEPARKRIVGPDSASIRYLLFFVFSNPLRCTFRHRTVCSTYSP
jgi:hypothetical protein